MTLQEQWQQDVATDGDKAYLKWQFKHKNKEVWKDLECNAAIHRLPVFEFRRKE